MTLPYYLLHTGSTEIIISGPFTHTELLAILKRDYETPPNFLHQMPTGSLSYVGDAIIVFKAEVIVPTLK